MTGMQSVENLVEDQVGIRWGLSGDQVGIEFPYLTDHQIFNVFLSGVVEHHTTFAPKFPSAWQD